MSPPPTDPGFLAPYLERFVPWLYQDSLWWSVIGTVGGVIFGGRFIVQWLFSEFKGRIVVPSLFWQLSLWGSCLTFFYFLHLDKFPPILSNCFLPFIYARNLWLYYHPKTKAETEKLKVES